MKNESAQPLLRVRKWDELYENNRSREIARTSWFPAPNDLSADGYVELVTHEEGAAHLGIWTSLLMVASRATPRGHLVREDGRPHNGASLARVTRLPEALIKAAIDRLLEIGLLELVDKPEPSSHPAAGRPQDPAAESQDGVVEGNGTEHHHREGKRTAAKRTRTTHHRPDSPPDEFKTALSAPRSAKPVLSKESVDDDDRKTSEILYASPEDELKAIYEAKTRERITVALLDAIRIDLELAGVGMGDFVVEVKKHVQNKWRNPAGFLRHLSRRFHAETRSASRPVTAAEAAARDYQCPKCHSKVPGEGILPGVDGKFVPCSCASPEYTARQRERGVLAEESAA